MHSLRFEFSPIRQKWFVYLEGDESVHADGNSQLDALGHLVWNYRDIFDIGEVRYVVLLREQSEFSVSPWPSLVTK